MFRHRTHPEVRSGLGRALPHRIARVRSAAFVVAFCGVCSVRSTVQAAPDAAPAVPHEPTEAERAEERALRELMRAGAQEAEAGNWDGAARAYRSAWHVREHFAIALNLAEAEMKLGNYLKAAGLWQFYLDHVPPELKDSDTDAEAQLAECRAHLGSVQISVEGGLATVLVNDAEVGQAPFDAPLWLDPGTYEIRARRGDERSLPSPLRLEAGAATSVYVTFPSTDAKPLASTVPVSSEPSAAKQDVAMSTVSTSTQTYVLIGGSVLTAVALGIGVGYWSQADQLQDDAESTRETAVREAEENGLVPENACRANPEVRPSGCSTLSKQWNDQATASDISRGAFIAAAVLGVGTAVTYLLWPSPESSESGSKPQPRVSVGLWLPGTGSGATIEGTF